ncbi:MAG: SIS domain-containing protein [Solirubrobacterales bacterium]|nr:SIS domain-containing protein [Solirubrobacterales bacterium]
MPVTDERALQLVRARLDEGRALVEAVIGSERCIEQIAAAAETIAAAAVRGNKLLLFGNGGSAADAVHVAAEFVGRYLTERRPLPALALNANISALTAIGNDYGFEEIFARQVTALGQEGDVAVGLTTSGRSPNVARGLEAAGELGIATIAMTGADPGPVGAAAELVVAMPSTETPRIQEGHMLAAHTICEWVEATIAGQEPAA